MVNKDTFDAASAALTIIDSVIVVMIVLTLAAKDLIASAFLPFVLWVVGWLGMLVIILLFKEKILFKFLKYPFRGGIYVEAAWRSLATIPILIFGLLPATRNALFRGFGVAASIDKTIAWQAASILPGTISEYIRIGFIAPVVEEGAWLFFVFGFLLLSIVVYDKALGIDLETPFGIFLTIATAILAASAFFASLHNPADFWYLFTFRIVISSFMFGVGVFGFGVNLHKLNNIMYLGALAFILSAVPTWAGLLLILYFILDPLLVVAGIHRGELTWEKMRPPWLK